MALEFLYFIDPETMILGLLFVIIFVLVNWATFKTVKNSGLSAIISFCISAIAIYGIFKMNFNFTEIFYSFGFSQDLLYTVVPILIIAGLIFLAKKLGGQKGFTFGFARLSLILGITFSGLSFTNLFYEKGIILAIGIGFIILGAIILFVSKKKDKINSNHKDNSQRNYYKNLEKDRRKQEKLERKQSRRERRKQRNYEKQRKKQEKRDLEIQKQQEKEYGKQRRRQQSKERTEELGRKVGYNLAKGAHKTKQYSQKAANYANKKINQAYETGQKINKKLGETAGYTKDQIRAMNKEIEKRKRAANIAKIRKEKSQKQQATKQKRIKRLEKLYGEKKREWQKQKMMAAKGVKNAADKVKRLESEIQYIVNEANKLKSS